MSLVNNNKKLYLKYCFVVDCENISQSYILIRDLPSVFSATVVAVLLIYRNV